MNGDKMVHVLISFLCVCFLTASFAATPRTDWQAKFDSVKEAIITQVKNDSDTESLRSPVFVKQTYRAAREAQETADRLTDTYAGAPVPGGVPLTTEQAEYLAETYKKNADFDLTDNNFADKVRPIKSHPTESFFDLIKTRLEKANNTNTPIQQANTSSMKTLQPSWEQTLTPPTDEQRARLLAHQKELRKQLGRRSFLINLNLF